MKSRAASSSHGLTATATHDTKRGEMRAPDCCAFRNPGGLGGGGRSVAEHERAL